MCLAKNETDDLGQSVKCLNQENRLDMIGWDNTIFQDVIYVLLKMSKVKHREALDEPKARLVTLKGQGSFERSCCFFTFRMFQFHYALRLYPYGFEFLTSLSAQIGTVFSLEVALVLLFLLGSYWGFILLPP